MVKRENKGTERLTRLACTTIGAVRLASHVGRRDLVSNDGIIYMWEISIASMLFMYAQASTARKIA